MWKFVQPSLAIVALLALASPAAADTTFSNASTMARPKPFDLHDYFTMDLTFYYFGASVTGMGSPYQPTADGFDDTDNKTSFMTRFRPAYRITPDITIGPVLEWNYFPNFGGDYNFGDLFVRVSHGKVVDTPQFKMAGELRFYFPSSGPSIDKDMIFSARAYHDNYYTFKGTNFSLGYEQFLRGWSYGNAAKADLPLVYWWWGGYANYDFTPAWSAKIEVDGAFFSSTGTNDIKNDLTHLRLGFGWSPTPTIALAPHLYVPVTSFSWSAAAFNLEAWAKLF